MDKDQVEKEIQSIVKQLVEKYKPEKVILFGSAARGRFGPDSDLDFLIVKQTKKPPWERRREITRLVTPNIAADFLVYTPKELTYEEKIGDFFIEEILAQGKVLYGKT